MIVFGEKLANVYPQGRLISIVNLVNFRILISVLLVTPLVFVIGVFLSHKIAGPVYRINKFLKDVTAGNLATPLVLRHGDELTDLADTINHMTDSLKTTINEQRVVIKRITNEIDSLRKTASCGDAVIRLEKEIKNIKATLEKYKI
jgi:signal transduction histidine kinase